MTSVRVHDEWLLLPERLALHEPTATVVVADVHLGYSAVRRRLGDAIPLPGMSQTLAPLARAAAGQRIAQLVVAGDLFERGVDRVLFEQFQEGLRKLQIAFAGLVPGNHDRFGPEHAEVIPRWPDDTKLGKWTVQHGDAEMGTDPVVCGHWHPSVVVEGRKRPCFVVGKNRIVLPAYSLDAAGASVRGDPRWREADWYAIVGGELTPVHSVAPRRLL